MTKVISGFPGVGKSHFFRTSALVVSDSDSSNFSWLRPGERHPDFPHNYMRHIKELLGETEVILVSSHKEVRDALVDNAIRFTLVYPQRSIKQRYMDRYRVRGSDAAFLSLLDKMWDTWIGELQEQPHCERIELGEGEYLSDVLLSGDPK